MKGVQYGPDLLKNFKKLCSLQLWGGSRKIDTLGQQVTVDSPSIMGKCLLQGGLWKGQDRSASSTCNKWEKWAPLK
jgi:hypothetical protein